MWRGSIAEIVAHAGDLVLGGEWLERFARGPAKAHLSDGEAVAKMGTRGFGSRFGIWATRLDESWDTQRLTSKLSVWK